MAKRKTILFLCTGNYYRSRFAEVLFVSVARKMGLPWDASSRALALERGVNNIGPMATAAIKALESMGIRDGDRCNRCPAQVTIEELEQADTIIALKHVEHLPLLQERFPTFAERVEFWHVDDAPEALGLIETKIMDLMARLLGGGGEAPRQDVPEVAPSSVTPPKPMKAKVGRETAGRNQPRRTFWVTCSLHEAGSLVMNDSIHAVTTCRHATAIAETVATTAGTMTSTTGVPTGTDALRSWLVIRI